MNFEYSNKAVAQLHALQSQIQERIAEKMRFFAAQQDPLVFAVYVTSKKEYRFRVGHYRILFKVSDGTIWITKIERRDKVYN